MFKEDVHIGLTTKTSKVSSTIEFEEDDLIREGMSDRFLKGKVDLKHQNYYVGEWLVDLWGRDKAGSLVGDSIFGGYELAEWEGESTISLLKFWRLTKVETVERRGKVYHVIYSGKRHWDIDEDLYQEEKDFLPIVFSLATDTTNVVEFESDGIYYIANGFNTVAVTHPDDEDFRYKGCVEIPSHVTFRRKTYVVNEIRDMSHSEELTEIKIPDTVTTIAKSAFFRDKSLRAANLPDSLQLIDKNAFWGCVSLEKIVLPEKCTVLDFAFAFCEGAKEIVPNACSMKNEGVFRNCISLESIKIPIATEGIYRLVFENCKKLKKVVLNEGLESLHGDAFRGCAIEEIFIPRSVRHVYSPFECENLKNIFVDPENENLSSVDGVLYSEGKRRLEQFPRGREGEFVVPESVVYIESQAFEYCTRLTKIIIPNNVKFLGFESFYGCESLQKVSIGDCIAKIGERTFAYCESLSSVEMGKGVETIENEAFYRCENLTSVKFSSSLNWIGPRAFAQCKALTEVHIPDSLKSFNRKAFEGCINLTTLTIPEWLESSRYDIMAYAKGEIR